MANSDDHLRIRPADDYETSFMGVDEQVVLRDKMSVHPGLHIAMLWAVLVGIAAIATSGAPLVLAALPVLAGLIFFSMAATLRTTVSKENVHVQYGLIGPTIPITSIKSVKAVDYSWLKYGGWGIRYAITDGSWCYNMIGDGGKAVEIQYEKNGKAKKVLVASKQNVLLADAIDHAMHAADEVTFDFKENATKLTDGDDVAEDSVEAPEIVEKR
ncbi:MAG: hypothetical protein R3E66_24905 [bacterium]